MQMFRITRAIETLTIGAEFHEIFSSVTSEFISGRLEQRYEFVNDAGQNDDTSREREETANRSVPKEKDVA
uniref:Uncharacterized protein n=1 Tax=Setaria digitata TaxID=48799 RepID=A0A915Q446_9BILA